MRFVGFDKVKLVDNEIFKEYSETYFDCLGFRKIDTCINKDISTGRNQAIF